MRDSNWALKLKADNEGQSVAQWNSALFGLEKTQDGFALVRKRVTVHAVRILV